MPRSALQCCLFIDNLVNSVTQGVSLSAGDGSLHWRGRELLSAGPCDLLLRRGHSSPPPVSFGWAGRLCDALQEKGEKNV